MNISEDTHIIFIHGLESKPAEVQLHALWKKALIENIRVDPKSLANQNDCEFFDAA